MRVLFPVTVNGLDGACLNFQHSKLGLQARFHALSMQTQLLLVGG